MRVAQPAQSLASRIDQLLGFKAVDDGVGQGFGRERLDDVAKQIAVQIGAWTCKADGIKRVDDRVDTAKPVEFPLLNGSHRQYSSGRRSVRTRTQSLSDAGSAANFSD
ncbi:hypothetical protein D3C80_1894440 [compost metagenome]